MIQVVTFPLLQRTFWFMTEARTCLQRCSARSRRDDLGNSHMGSGKDQKRRFHNPLIYLILSLVFLGSTPGQYRENRVAVPLSDLARPWGAH